MHRVSASLTTSYVLLVEGDLVSRKIHASLLKKLGFQVDVVSNGQQALFQLRSRRIYQFILMDLQLPDMSAKQLVKLCHRHGNILETKVAVLIDDLIKWDTLYSCLDAGIFSTIRKPINLAHIEELITEQEMDLALMW